MTTEHPLVSVVYCSTATRPFTDEELAGLLEQSRASNDTRDITGMLLYRGGEFIQILEGDKYDVDGLMSRIAQDPRHRDVRVLLEEPLRERRFSEWTMGYQPLTTPPAGEVHGYRDSFEDLRIGDQDMIGRALMELTMWFRVRESDSSVTT